MTPAARRPWVVGVSGASGTPYARAVLRGLVDAGEDVDLIVSRAARLTLLDETGITFRQSSWRADVARWIDRDSDRMCCWHIDNLAAGPSSGSYRTRGAIIVPASTASVAGIATGMSKDLLQRVGDVTLKERRPLILVVREAPLRRATLRQLADLADEGAIVMPASPAFYTGATTVDQLVDFMAGRILDVAGVDHDLFQRWTGHLGSGRKNAREGDDTDDESTRGNVAPAGRNRWS